LGNPKQLVDANINVTTHGSRNDTFVKHNKTEDDKILRLRAAFKNDKPEESDYEIIVPDFNAVELRKSLSKKIFESF